MALASQDWDRDEDHLALVAELLDGLPDKERVGGGAAGDQSCVTRRNHGKKTHRLWGMNIYIILYLQIIYTWHIISYIIYTIYYIYLFIIHAYTSIKTWEKYSSLGNEDHVLNTAGFHFDRRRLRTSACLESIPRRRTVCGCLVMWIMWYVPGLVMTHSLRHWTWPYIEIVDLPSYKMLDLSMFKVTRGYQRVCFTIIHRIYMTQMWKVHMWIGSEPPSSGPCRSARALDVLLTGFLQQLGQAETHQELQAVSAWFRSWTQKSGICLVQDVQDVHVLWMNMGIIFPIMAAFFFART